MHLNVWALEQFTVVTRNFEFWDQRFPRSNKYISMINVPATMRGVNQLILNSQSALFWAIDSRIYVVSILEHFRFILEDLLNNIFEQWTWVRFNNFDATILHNFLEPTFKIFKIVGNFVIFHLLRVTMWKESIFEVTKV